MTKRAFKPGDVICKEGESGGTLYLIESGFVSVDKKAFERGATSKTVAQLGPGEFFGEMSFLQGLPHSATVVAKTDASLLLLSRSTLDELIRKEPSAAVNEVLNVAMGLSGRLRATTRELVTVYEMARAVGSTKSMEDLAKQAVGQLQLDLGAESSVAFYRWNMFNEEYALLQAQGPEAGRFPTVVGDKLDSISFKKGHTVISRIDMLDQRQGLCAYHSDRKEPFDPGERQMMETVSAVLAPALASALAREEDEARRMHERNKQSGYNL